MIEKGEIEAPKIAANISAAAQAGFDCRSAATALFASVSGANSDSDANFVSDVPFQRGPSAWTLAALALAIIVLGALVWQFVGAMAALIGAGVALTAGAVTAGRRFLVRRPTARALDSEMREAVGDAGEPVDAPGSAKADFISQMSHEIRTPMNAILGMAELLDDSELSPEQRKYLSIMRNNGTALLELIDDILDFSRIGSGRLSLESINFDLRELAERVVETFSIRAHRKGLEIALRIAPEVPVALVGDPLRLRQVLVNLVGNAIKFTEQGEVVLQVDRASLGELHFAVSDTGIGIAADQRERIFDRYTQASVAIAREHGGTGLGLAIVRQLAEMMGGRIWVESELGKGSTFHFVARFTEQPRNRAAEARAVRLGIAGERVLIAERSTIARRALAETLEQCGAQVKEVSDGEQAIDELGRQDGGGKPFRIVLWECRAGAPEGLDLAGRIRDAAQSAGMVVPMLTSDDLNVQLPRLRRIGFVHHIIKPVRRSELFGLIRTLFGDGGSHLTEASPQVSAAIADRNTAIGDGVSITEIEPVERIGSARAEVQPALIERPLRILIADDSEDNRLLIQAFLKQISCRVEHAENGEVALAKFAAGCYDVVLMDIQMPVMDGYTAAKLIRQWELRNRAARTPIIALTASVLDEAVHKSFEAGCDTHVAKPVRRPTLLAAIHEVTATAEATALPKSASVAADTASSIIRKQRYAAAAR